jgi:hypothetical protein
VCDLSCDKHQRMPVVTRGGDPRQAAAELAAGEIAAEHAGLAQDIGVFKQAHELLSQRLTVRRRA